jgi:hypothetical protein
MKTINEESMAFLREYFRIPKHYKTNWCLVEEDDLDSCVIRLGLQINNGNTYVDVANRCFASSGRCGCVVRKIYPATRSSLGRSYRFQALDKPEIIKDVSKTYISDIYYPAYFRKELLNDKLF